VNNIILKKVAKAKNAISLFTLLRLKTNGLPDLEHFPKNFWSISSETAVSDKLKLNYIEHLMLFL